MSMRPLFRLACLLAGAAGALPHHAADVVVWHGYRGEERAALEHVVSAYNAAQGSRGDRVTLLAVPSDAFLDKVTAAVPRGKGPDVFLGPQDRLGGWIVAKNTVEPIDFFLDAANRARFIPATVQAMTYHGAMYGLPLNYKVITLIHNRALVKQAPGTTAELAEVARRLTNRATGTYGLAYAYTDYYYHAALQNGFGGRVFDQATHPLLDSPENVRALELLLRWKDAFLPAEPSTALITSLFNEGKAAMVFSGPWFLGEIAKGIDYGLAPLPAISEAGGQPMRPWMTVEGVFVSMPSRQKDAAFAFARFLTGAEGGRIMALEGRQSPANQQVYLDPVVAGDPTLQSFHRQVRTAVPMPNVPEMTMMWSPATSALGAVARRSATPEAALAKAQAQVAKDVAALRHP